SKAFTDTSRARAGSSASRATGASCARQAARVRLDEIQPDYVSVFRVVLLAQDLSDGFLDPFLDGLRVETSIGVCAEAVDAPVAAVGPDGLFLLLRSRGVLSRYPPKSALPPVSPARVEHQPDGVHFHRCTLQ